MRDVQAAGWTRILRRSVPGVLSGSKPLGTAASKLTLLLMTFSTEDLLPWRKNRPRRILVKICPANATPGNFNDYLSRTADLRRRSLFYTQIFTSVKT